MLWRIMEDPMSGIALLSMLILAISVHEMAHAWMALRCGDDTAARLGRLTINPAVHFDPMGILFIMMAPFGWGKPVPFNPMNLSDYHRDSMYIAWAGPASNFIQAIVLAILFRLLETDIAYSLFMMLPSGSNIYNACGLVFFWGVWINIVLAFFNLLPLFPLDGEKILQGLVSREQAIKIEEFRQHSMMILFILIGSSFFLGFSILGVYFNITAMPVISLLLG